jgi:hypothetical protein
VILCVLNSSYMVFLNWDLSRELLWTLTLHCRSCPLQLCSSHQAEPLASMVYHLSSISTFGGLLGRIFMKWCVNLFMRVLFLYPVNMLCFHCCQKKGRFGSFKNCRPVALLCAEYKMTFKCLKQVQIIFWAVGPQGPVLLCT